MTNGLEQEGRKKKFEKIYEVRLTSGFGPTDFPHLLNHSTCKHELAPNENVVDSRARARAKARDVPSLCVTNLTL
jgi:hypothetical protein